MKFTSLLEIKSIDTTKFISHSKKNKLHDTIWLTRRLANTVFVKSD